MLRINMGEEKKVVVDDTYLNKGLDRLVQIDLLMDSVMKEVGYRDYLCSDRSMEV